MSKIKNRTLQFFRLLKYYILLLLCKLLSIKHDDVWIISERGIDARDNGYALYNTWKINVKNQKVYFIISRNSPDNKKIERNDIIKYRSLKHYIYFITSGTLISTHLMGMSPDMGLFNKLNKKNLLKNRGKIISLKHGITKDFLPQLNQKDTKLNLIISGAYPEYRYFIKKLGFSKNIVKYTGFARFDTLIDESDGSNIILLMPTFRTWQTYNSADEFKKSSWYKHYYKLITDEKLLKMLEKHNLKLVFYPHIEFQKYLYLFKTSNKRIILASVNNYDVQKLLKVSKLLITDYSSVFFDFAYMQKPVIYYQFDKEEYRNNHYKEGYFIYEKDGFGPVVYNESDLINTIKKYINESFKLDKQYRQRIQKYYKYNDNNNCKRICDEIYKISRGNNS